MRAIGISIPTMPFNLRGDERPGASETCHGARRAVLRAAVRSLDLLPQPGRVVDDPRPAPGMHGDVIPRRHDLSVLALGRDTSDGLMYCCGPWNTTRHSSTRRKLCELRIGAREMSAQRAMRPDARIDQERDVVGLQTARACCNQQAERMRADQRVLNREPVLAKVRRLVHAMNSNS